MLKSIILKTMLPPGDLCTLTAAIQSLHDSFPGWFRTDVRTSCDALFENNPNIKRLLESNATVIDCHYTRSINTSNQIASSFLRGYCIDLGKKLGIKLDLTTNRPHLFLSADEKLPPVEFEGTAIPSRYWLVNAGIKNDFTLKQWPVEYYQAVIDHFRDRVQFIQVGGQNDGHPRLDGVCNLVGKTNIRQLMRLAYHAEGGVGPITLLQHLCAAFEKPYVALLGGREPVAWTQYPLQTTLHTLGRLPCCRTAACWRSRVVPLGDGDEKDSSLCEAPVLTFNRPVGKCMAMIEPEDVIRAIERGDDHVSGRGTA
jgi:ADP-heptose:LPS heptosyltransferase